jgi:microcystin-dependent protein
VWLCAGPKVYRAATNLTPMGAGLTTSGGGAPHENRQPYLGLTFIIALSGIFPSRS